MFGLLPCAADGGDAAAGAQVGGIPRLASQLGRKAVRPSSITRQEKVEWIRPYLTDMSKIFALAGHCLQANRIKLGGA
ncbi:hypothetical protein BVG79_02179 [Ketogulonicigenium robustum]|uniref:Uncharacterized protein n=1 Tax=Ketogulonicigenium robustum TaxID=92947 RepID=A0A1W6P256_9RHOB|nr:hypothetical protein BVG79_02179 [Ketogulonicigenium robustum]